MAKICFYCGKELLTGETCNCRTSASSSNGKTSTGTRDTSGQSSKPKGAESSRTADRTERERERREKARLKEQTRRAREASRKQKPAFDWKTFLFKLMTSSGYSPADSFPKKAGLSFLQTILRPVTAIETFVSHQDKILGLFYIALFSLSTGLASMRFFGYTPLNFLEGSILGLVIAGIYNGLFLLVFRFLSRIRFRFNQIISTFSAPSVFLSLFLLFASSSRTGLLTFLLTLMTGIITGALLQFLSLRALSKLTSEQLVVNVIFVYVVFFAILGIILNLIMPTAATVL